jgi:hypothetical protein
MGKARHLRTDAETRTISKHLLYEIQMFVVVTDLLDTFWIAESSAQMHGTRNAVLESWALHVRNLLDFLYGRGGPRDHVRAEDFLDEGCTLASRSEVLRRAQRRANKEIAHLSYDRDIVTVEQKPWDVAEIVRELTSALREFIELASADRVAVGFVEQVAALLPSEKRHGGDRARRLHHHGDHKLDDAHVLSG